MKILRQGKQKPHLPEKTQKPSNTIKVTPTAPKIDYNNIIETQKAQIADLNSQNVKNKMKYAAIDTKCTELEAKCAELEAKCAELDAKCSELTADRAPLDAKCAELEAKCAELEAKCCELTTDRAVLDAKCAEFEAKCAELEATNTQIVADNEEYHVKNQKLRKYNKKLELQISESTQPVCSDE